MNKVVVIGAGASGLTAAIWAARTGAQVTILEHNEKVGKKILATGNGRCNLTNTTQDASYYRSSQRDFPWKVVSQFNHLDTLRFFSKLGIFTKNKDGWMYPYSEQAASVAEVLEMEARHLKVKIKTNEEVTDIQILSSGYQILTKTWQYNCDCVIVACGSPASNVEGSSSTGYELAKKLGHTLIPPMPALSGLKGRGNYFGKWAGCRMECRVSLEIAGRIFKEEQGEVLFTEYGISGIPVFQVSRYAVRAIKENCTATVHLDLMPDLTEESLLALLKQRKEENSYKTLSQRMIGLLPKKIIATLVSDKETEEDVVKNIKDWKVPIKDAYSLKQAQVCSGGVDTRELTTQMESIFHPGLFFTGEVVDVDGPCGGYNLQWAWSSGTVAGITAAQSIYKE